jgi:hypothetical protein
MKMKLIYFLILVSIAGISHAQVDSTGLNNIFGKKGTVQGMVYRITYPRSDLKVTVNNFKVSPGLALTSWIGILFMGTESMMMGDLVMQDSEESAVVAKLVSSGLSIIAIHNHLTNEQPAIKYIHFSGSGDPLKLATPLNQFCNHRTPLAVAPPRKPLLADWSKVEAILENPKAQWHVDTI